MSRPATLSDIAKHANVSKMTVSLCLKEDGWQGRVTEATRNRVLAVVREFGYRPNPIGQQLRSGQSNVIALYAGQGFVNVRIPYLRDIVSGLQEGCEEARKDLLLHGNFHSADPAALYSELISGRIGGLVLDAGPSDALLKDIVQSNFPAIAVSNAVNLVPSIVVDDRAGAALIAKHLYELGHRSVAFAVRDGEMVSARLRRDSFLEVAMKLKMRVTVFCPSETDPMEQTLRQLLDDGITAVACWNDELAHLMVSEALRCGIEVPAKLAITGFDGCPARYQEANPLTTIAAPWTEVARLAVLNLSRRMSGEQVPDLIVLPVSFVKGKTT